MENVAVCGKQGGVISERAKIFIFQIETSIDNVYTTKSKGCHYKHVF